MFTDCPLAFKAWPRDKDVLSSIVLTAIAPSGSSVISGLGDWVYVDFEARAQVTGDIASSLLS